MQEFPPTKAVVKNVYFTRTLFSKLAFQPMISPVPSGFISSKIYNIEEVSSIFNSTEEAKQALELGIKLACGFEILMSRHNCTTYTLERDARYKHFITHLLSEGFFCGELEGSIKYKELEKRAQLQYIHSKASTNLDVAPEVKITTLLTQDLSQVSDTNDWEKDVPSNLNWLELTPAELQQILKSKAAEELEIVSW